jgi:hypothetical protein
MGRHDDHAGMDVFGFAHDLFERSANPETASAILMQRAQIFLQRCEFSFPTAFFRIKGAFRARLYLCIRGVRLLQNVKERQVGIKLFRQRERVPKRDHGLRSQVSRNKNCLNLHRRPPVELGFVFHGFCLVGYRIKALFALNSQELFAESFRSLIDLLIIK